MTYDPNLAEATTETQGHTAVVLAAFALVGLAGTAVLVFLVPPGYVAAALTFGPVLLFATGVLIAHWRIHHPPTAE